MDVDQAVGEQLRGVLPRGRRVRVVSEPGERRQRLVQRIEGLGDLLAVPAEVQVRLVDGQILSRRDAFLQRAVDPDLVLVGLAADLHDRACVRDALERERLDARRLFRLRAAVVDVLAPLLAKLLVGNPLFEHAVEAFACLQQLLLELASRRALGLLMLELVVQVLVVMDERVQLLVERKRCRLRGPSRQEPEAGLEPAASALQERCSAS